LHPLETDAAVSKNYALSASDLDYGLVPWRGCCTGLLYAVRKIRAAIYRGRSMGARELVKHDHGTLPRRLYKLAREISMLRESVGEKSVLYSVYSDII